MFRKLILSVVAAVSVLSASAASVYIPENTPVKLQWDYPHDGLAYGFRLYNHGVLFKPYDVGAYINITTSNNGDTWQLTTDTLPAGDYDFTLTAVNAAGGESLPSNDVPLIALPKPVAPQLLRKI